MSLCDITFLIKVFYFTIIGNQSFLKIERSSKLKGENEMTDVIIVHSMHGNSRNHWYQWLEHNLTLEGYDVTLFNFESLKRRQWISGLKL